MPVDIIPGSQEPREDAAEQKLPSPGEINLEKFLSFDEQDPVALRLPLKDI